MRLAVAAATMLALAAPVAAQDLTVSECLGVGIALRALDCAGRDMDAQMSIDAKQTVAPACPKQYKLGALRGDLAFALADLSFVQLKAERARNELIAKIGEGKVIPPVSPQMNDFLAAFQKVLDAKCGVALPKIHRSDLNIGDGDGQNQIPMTVLGALRPIIIDLQLPPVQK